MAEIPIQNFDMKKYDKSWSYRIQIHQHHQGSQIYHHTLVHMECIVLD